MKTIDGETAREIRLAIEQEIKDAGLTPEFFKKLDSQSGVRIKWKGGTPILYIARSLIRPWGSGKISPLWMPIQRGMSNGNRPE